MTITETIAYSILAVSLLVALGAFIAFCAWYHDHRRTHFNP